METLVLAGGFLYIAVTGYFAVWRLGRFLDEGVISPGDEGEGDQDSCCAHRE